MALNLKGEASFHHDGEDLVIAVTIGVILEVEQEIGIGLLGVHAGLTSVRYCAALLRHGLAAGCGRRISLETAAEMVVVSDGCHDALIAAMNGFLPPPAPTPAASDGEAGASGENPIPAAGNGIGTSS